MELFAPRYIVPTYMLISHYAVLTYRYMVCHHSVSENLSHTLTWTGVDDIIVDIPTLLKFIWELGP